MTALVVVAHPDPTSFTQRLARSVADRLAEDAVSTAVADLHAEGFDPRFSLEDRAGYPAGGTPPADVLAQQRRLDGVDDLVLVFPVYWWSMPALLKGWVDRVFTDGWAFDTGVTPTGRRLDHLTVHLAMVAGRTPRDSRSAATTPPCPPRSSPAFSDTPAREPGTRESSTTRRRAHVTPSPGMRGRSWTAWRPGSVPRRRRLPVRGRELGG